MKEIVVISGKGGTGKTSLTSSLIPHIPNLVIADCDVDAPDLGILLRPEGEEVRDFVGAKKAQVNSERCMGCRLCDGVCRFEALTFGENDGEPVINPLRCEGCGLCSYLCPRDAIDLKDVVVGTLSSGQTKYGPMIQARLNPGEETSGKLVSEVRKEARKIAEAQEADVILVDGSPGIGCAVISSLTNADLALVVTEPSISAFHDLKRVHSLLTRFSIPGLVVVNKSDISPVVFSRIEAFCREVGLPLVMSLPFNLDMVTAISERDIPSLAQPAFFRENGFDDLLEILLGSRKAIVAGEVATSKW